MNVLSLFDGISCGREALKRINITPTNYFSSEIDKHALIIANKNHPTNIKTGSVLTVKGQNLPNIDLLLGGSPCQGFSFAGKQLNFEDPRSKLFFEYLRLLNETKPKYFLLENVPMKKEYQDIISDKLKCQPIIINSSYFSAQNRKRLYWTNIPIAPFTDKNIVLESIIGKYKGVNVLKRGVNKGGLRSYKGKSPTITTSSWQFNFKIVLETSMRKFTEEECEQLQTLPIGYTQGVPSTYRYKLLGNCWTVDVIAHILSALRTT